MRARWLIALVVSAVLAVAVHAQDKRYAVKGMVLRVDPATRTFVVSHDAIEGLMSAMIMPFEVRDARDLMPLAPGAIVEFTLVVGAQAGYAADIRVRKYQTAEQDPLTARRLALLKKAAGRAVPPLATGEPVPDFTLTDQAGQPVRLSAIGAGKVVALNFVYTRCALPQFCLRASNVFSTMQRRFARQYGRDLVLLTVTFDPERDTPEVLATYAARFNADPKMWRFLTGKTADVRRVCALFGVESYLDEGLVNHSLHTAVIDRRGRLVANIEGNQYTPEQLGDLILETLTR
ncbi:MAG TPA: SCO family protein [Vicinamibacterales bacterium]|nr:SCO family protein [Vicinamibacterales bacterium]